MLHTKRLYIRQWELADSDALAEIANQEHVNRWLPDWLNCREWVIPWIEKVSRHYAIDNPITNFLSWAVVFSDNDRVIGQINIGSDSFEGKEVGIGYFIDENYCNCGYASEAAAVLVEHTFKKYGFDHLAATVQPHNYASIAVVEKVGFRFIKTIMRKDSGQSEALPFNYYRLDLNHFKEA